MENKSLEKAEIINCSHCKLPLLKQVRNETVKRAEIIYRNEGVVGPIAIDIENKKLPLEITCPRCKKSMPLTFIVGELTGIIFNFKGGLTEIINGKAKRIAKSKERKFRKLYVRLKSSRK